MATQSNPQAVIDRLQTAQNQHDLEAFVACIAPDYQSEQPVHPARAFHGSEQVRKHWSAMFNGVPDFHSDRKIVEYWMHSDVLALMQQLGVQS